MLQWIKNFPLPLIYLSFLLLWLYYAIFSASYLALLGFVFLLVCLFSNFRGNQLVKFYCFAEYLDSGFCFKIGNRVKRVKNLADFVERVRILPDTIKSMVTVYPFVASLMDAFFKFIINSSAEEEKETFQALTDIHEIGLEGKLERFLSPPRTGVYNKLEKMRPSDLPRKDRLSPLTLIVSGKIRTLSTESAKF